MKRKLVTALVAVAAVATAGIAYAAIPSGNGVISACKTKDGAVKLIDKEAGQGCNSSQQLVEWNQQGPPGPTGRRARQGPRVTTAFPVTASSRRPGRSLAPERGSSWRRAPRARRFSAAVGGRTLKPT
jgi:hypothetical protein